MKYILVLEVAKTDILCMTGFDEVRNKSKIKVLVRSENEDSTIMALTHSCMALSNMERNSDSGFSISTLAAWSLNRCDLLIISPRKDSQSTPTR